jgi:Matrixin
MKNLIACLLTAVAPAATALTIKIDYTYDTNTFFNTPEKKSAMEAVAKFYGDLITDNLLRIDPADFEDASWTARPLNPATGVEISIPNLVVPANTIIVYVGSRTLPPASLGRGGPGGYGASGYTEWFDVLAGRGSAGAAVKPSTARTDHCPWGGSIAFDSVGPWNFSQSENLEGYEFIAVALHEMGHVLGIGTADSWKNKVASGTFTGPFVIRSYGGAPTLDAGNAHFAVSSRDSPRFGSFGKSHGTLAPTNMLAVLTEDDTTYLVATDLDLAALVDCGWEIRPPLGLSVSSLSPSGAGFSWKSSSFLDYAVQRSGDLVTFSSPSGVLAGTGAVQAWNDAAPLASKGFYRLRSTQPTAFPAARSALKLQSTGEFRTHTVAPVSVSCCAVEPGAVLNEK